MKNSFRWDEAKNEILKEERNISFDEVIEAIEFGGLLDNINHPNQEKYGHQNILVVEINSYAYYVPYVIEENGSYFLKTIYKNRKARKQYLST